ncbi:DnaB-like helicase C-terminal domain-containing protein [Bradyrhizobium sp. SZCCHNRI2010]|uniref:DnaB-like helicase C-terminal domain-containing protein n=1 Tax=Bradyrhizobium sp. SZCCHNRI2010 TaxID=3057283 RepID=UPI0028F11C59|nr:DnaB-like helicase C-terminal domain-containing protein [Bradyrhizobium sp. SZCCHNRI2010]
MLSEKHAKGLEDRSLSIELAADMGLYSGTLCRDGQDNLIVEPDPDGKVLCWPYFEGDLEVNTKYRWRNKDGDRCFMQRKGAPKTLYNANVLLDEANLLRLQDGMESLIWVEGEPDCHAVKLCGYHSVVSVPDGAPPARDKHGNLIPVPDDDKDIDPNDDDKFSFMRRLEDYLARVKHHIIAVDGDEAGGRLAKELARRLGVAKCFWIEYPKDEVVPDKHRPGKKRACKDMNEVKMYLGADAVRDIIDNAKPWPVKNLYRLSDYPDVELPQMAEVKISDELDRHMKFYPGQFAVWTGIPNVGKSTLVNQVIVHLAKLHKWPVVIFSGEKDVKPFLAQELMTAFLGKAKPEWSMEEKQRAQNFVQRYFQFIDYDDTLDEEIGLDFILEKAATAVFRDGARVLLIDPWNELEHSRPMNISLTEYVGKAIRKMKRFGKMFGVSVHVVAHPTKIDLKTVPTLYNISDSAHWYNKADLGVVVHADQERIAEAPNERDIIVAKVRLKRIAGMTGSVPLNFDDRAGIFTKPPF